MELGLARRSPSRDASGLRGKGPFPSNIGFVAVLETQPIPGIGKVGVSGTESR